MHQDVTPPDDNENDSSVRLQQSEASPEVMDIAVSNLGDLHAVGSIADQVVALLEREEGALRWVIARYVRDASTVDDIFQEVSIKVLKRIDTVRDQDALRGWLFQLARNACLDWLRSSDRRKKIVNSDDLLADRSAKGDMGRNSVDVIISRERIDAVRRALGELPVAQREALLLRIDEELDHEAIAARLGISRQAVEVRLCRGRAALKERLGDIFGGEL